MAIKESRKIEVEGELEYRYKFWEDSDEGYFIDGDKFESVLNNFRNKKVRITIEQID